VILPTAFVAHNLPEFADGMARVSVHSIHHHFIEARLRLKLTSNDFSLWLEEEMEMKEVARRLNHIDIYTATLEDVRRQAIRIIELALQ
jgi:elongation factor P hydroxylase